MLCFISRTLELLLSVFRERLHLMHAQHWAHQYLGLSGLPRKLFFFFHFLFDAKQWSQHANQLAKSPVRFTFVPFLLHLIHSPNCVSFHSKCSVSFKCIDDLVAFSHYRHFRLFKFIFFAADCLCRFECRRLMCSYYGAIEFEVNTKEMAVHDLFLFVHSQCFLHCFTAQNLIQSLFSFSVFFQFVLVHSFAHSALRQTDEILRVHFIITIHFLIFICTDNECRLWNVYAQ